MAYWITSSALANRLSGRFSPSAPADVLLIDRQLEFRRLLDRQVRRLCALEDAVDEIGLAMTGD